MNPVIELILNRKSVRAFEEIEISPEVKDEILSATMRAPTAGNMMLYSIIDVRDPNSKRALVRTCDNQDFIAPAPWVLLFLADYQRWYDGFLVSEADRLCEKRNIAMRKPEEGDMFLACCDALIAAHTAVIAAESLGIGSCYIGDITDARLAWPAERQNAWLQKFNYATLADVTAHEVYPGHFAHSLFMRRAPGKIRRIWIGLNPFPRPSSGQDGWAHYAEQMILDAGFHAEDPRYRLAQLSEALTRICRLIVGIKVHTGAWTVEEGARCFEQQAHLPAPAALQEAERASYDPTYGGYFLGKVALLKLRKDVDEREGSSFDLHRFHERVMTNGIAPWWAHRQLFLPGDSRPVIE